MSFAFLAITTVMLPISCSDTSAPDTPGSATPTTTPNLFWTPTPTGTSSGGTSGSGSASGGSSTPLSITDSDLTQKDTCNDGGKVYVYGTTNAPSACSSTITLSSTCNATWVDTEFTKCSASIGDQAVAAANAKTSAGYTYDQCGVDSSTSKPIAIFANGSAWSAIRCP
jgi:hypothetical protein